MYKQLNETPSSSSNNPEFNRNRSITSRASGVWSEVKQKVFRKSSSDQNKTTEQIIGSQSIPPIRPNESRYDPPRFPGDGSKSQNRAATFSPEVAMQLLMTDASTVLDIPQRVAAGEKAGSSSDFSTSPANTPPIMTRSSRAARSALEAYRMHATESTPDLLDFSTTTVRTPSKQGTSDLINFDDSPDRKNGGGQPRSYGMGASPSTPELISKVHSNLLIGDGPASSSTSIPNNQSSNIGGTNPYTMNNQSSNVGGVNSYMTGGNASNFPNPYMLGNPGSNVSTPQQQIPPVGVGGGTGYSSYSNGGLSSTSNVGTQPVLSTGGFPITSYSGANNPYLAEMSSAPYSSNNVTSNSVPTSSPYDGFLSQTPVNSFSDNKAMPNTGTKTNISSFDNIPSVGGYRSDGGTVSSSPGILPQGVSETQKHSTNLLSDVIPTSSIHTSLSITSPKQISRTSVESPSLTPKGMNHPGNLGMIANSTMTLSSSESNVIEHHNVIDILGQKKSSNPYLAMMGDGLQNGTLNSSNPSTVVSPNQQPGIAQSHTPTVPPASISLSQSTVHKMPPSNTTPFDNLTTDFLTSSTPGISSSNPTPYDNTSQTLSKPDQTLGLPSPSKTITTTQSDSTATASPVLSKPDLSLLDF